MSSAFRPKAVEGPGPEAGDDRSPAEVPTLLLAIDLDFRITSASVPPAAGPEIKNACRRGQSVESLPWTNPNRVSRAIRSALRGRKQRFAANLGRAQIDGFAIPNYDSAGRITGAVIGGIDTVDLSATERELAELREALRHAQQVTSFAYYVVDMATEIVTITPAFAEIWDLARRTRDIPFRDLVRRIHPDDRAGFILSRREAMDGNTPLDVTFRIVRTDGEMRYIRVHASAFTDASGVVERSVGTVVDVTEQTKAKDELAFMASHDPLTGLLNRHSLIQGLGQSPKPSCSALLLLDLDRFAQINDIGGHALGDQLLRAVADRLRPLEFEGHFVARLGGDEFGCYLRNFPNREAADACVASVQRSLAEPYTIGHNQYIARATMGIAFEPEDGSGTLLLQNAGMALLSAKATAKGGILAYDPQLERKMSTRSRIQRDLESAVERGQFAMHYQPVIEAASGDVVGAEALLRWYHPDLGLLTPDVFLNVAEESDVVVSIGQWAIERACADATVMSQSMGRTFRLNVNVSARQVQSSELVGHVAGALSRSGMAASALQLEVTEQLLIEDIPSAVATLQNLRNSGVSIAIDDFGTGYNTLSYLKSYPVSCIKIDRAFVKDSEVDDYSRAICLSVKALAESLNMNVIGEGVETLGQADFLRTIGCQELQGFHFGRPVSMDDFIAAHGRGHWKN